MGVDSDLRADDLGLDLRADDLGVDSDLRADDLGLDLRADNLGVDSDLRADDLGVDSDLNADYLRMTWTHLCQLLL